ncbi:polysaccharide lyase 6 family protein [Paenibacillus sp. GYB003]|uniref:polysaccharide lyase 6 family protein n=1 Tax=Paenibacillus sp. GYB003 TaxID=2994392 RepID=UPI002F967A24
MHRAVLCLICLLALALVGSDHPFARAQTDERLVTTPAELEAAIADAEPGDVILMQDGVWKDIDILFDSSGLPDRPITLKAQTRGKVVISGSSSVQIAGDYLVVDGLYFKDGYSSRSLHLIEFRHGQKHANHSRLTNIVVSGFNKDPKKDTDDVWIGLFGTYNRVDHSLFLNKKPESSTLMIVWRATADANYHQIDHNYFRNINNDGWDGDAAIRIGDGQQALSASHTTVESNIFENMNGIGKIISLKSGGNLIRNNTFVNAQGSICIRQGNGNIIEGNFILPTTSTRYTGGILVMGSDTIIRNNYIQGVRTGGRSAIEVYDGHPDNTPGKGGYYPSKNISISNNTFVDNDKLFIIGQNYDVAQNIVVPVENISFKDNAVLGNGSKVPLMNILDRPINPEYDGNLFYNANFLGIEHIPGIRNADPQLKLGEDGLYYYAESSPLKNNIKSAPLKRTEVGPEWAKAEWGEFGIEDKPYVEQPFKDVNAVSIDETEISEIAPVTSKNYYSYIFGVIVIIAMGILLIAKKRTIRK